MCLQSGSNSLLSAEKTDLSRLLLHLLRPKTTCNEISLWFFCPILAVSSYKFWLYHHIKSDYLPAKTNLQTKNPDLKKTPFRDMAGFQLWFLFSVFFFPKKKKSSSVAPLPIPKFSARDSPQFWCLGRPSVDGNQKSGQRKPTWDVSTPHFIHGIN